MPNTIPDLSTPEKARAAWVAALRSGEYKQGRGALNHGDPYGQHEYCCLGVAGDLCVRAGRAEWREHTRKPYFGFFVAGILGVGGLPVNLLELFGLTYDVQGCLIQYNDIERMDFQQIADIIEADQIGMRLLDRDEEGQEIE